MYFPSVNRVYSNRPADLIDQTFPFQHRALKIYDAFFLFLWPQIPNLALLENCLAIVIVII